MALPRWSGPGKLAGDEVVIRTIGEMDRNQHGFDFGFVQRVKELLRVSLSQQKDEVAEGAIEN